jgi:hypothetical protein
MNIYISSVCCCSLTHGLIPSPHPALPVEWIGIVGSLLIALFENGFDTFDKPQSLEMKAIIMKHYRRSR